MAAVRKKKVQSRGTSKGTPEKKQVSLIKLSATVRRKIMKNLGISGSLRHIPDKITIARISHRDLKLTKAEAVKQAWLLVAC